MGRGQEQGPFRAEEARLGSQSRRRGRGRLQGGSLCLCMMARAQREGLVTRQSFHRRLQHTSRIQRLFRYPLVLSKDKKQVGLIPSPPTQYQWQ
eukprot:g2695.t1